MIEYCTINPIKGLFIILAIRLSEKVLICCFIMILQAIVQKNRQDFEMELYRVENDKKKLIDNHEQGHGVLVKEGGK